MPCLSRRPALATSSSVRRAEILLGHGWRGGGSPGRCECLRRCPRIPAIAGPVITQVFPSPIAHNAILTIFTGHRSPASRSPCSLSAIARTPGTVMPLGVEHLDGIVAEPGRGMPAQTPLSWCDVPTGAQRRWRNSKPSANAFAEWVAACGGRVRRRGYSSREA
jgi:hypothetical protein